jgi:RNA polymerase sigma-70 factor, ECF subfamily
VARFAPCSDRWLLDATRAGDAEAFGVLFERHHRVVLTFLRRRTTDPELAADLTAETFAAALVAAHQAGGERVDDAAPWLLGIARNKLLDSYRRGRAASGARDRLGLAELALRREDLDLVDQVAGMDGALRVSLDDLPQEERDAIVARFLLDHSYDEIAAASATSQAAVRKRVSRGLARLRDALERT